MIINIHERASIIFDHLLTFEMHLVELVIIKMNPFLIFEG